MTLDTPFYAIAWADFEAYDYTAPLARVTTQEDFLILHNMGFALIPEYLIPAGSR